MKLERYTLPAVLAVSAGASFLAGAFYKEQAGEEENRNSRSWNAVVLRDQAQTFDTTGWLALGAAGAITIRRRFK
jgi:hypothetical protein